MKTPPEIKTSSVKRKTRLFLFITAVSLALVAGFAWVAFSYFSNYAERTTRPLEAALAKAGAVKKCGAGDSGRGPSNDAPWYNAVYEVPGGEGEAAGLIRTAASEAGYTLKDGPEPGNPQDNKFYSDQSSKKSPYTDLESGSVNLRFTVFGSSVYNGESGSSCGLVKKDAPAQDKTTVRFTVNLPKFKH